MVTPKGKLTEADLAELARSQKRVEAINKREADAGYRGLASVLTATPARHPAKQV